MQLERASLLLDAKQPPFIEMLSVFVVVKELIRQQSKKRACEARRDELTKSSGLKNPRQQRQFCRNHYTWYAPREHLARVLSLEEHLVLHLEAETLRRRCARCFSRHAAVLH